MRSFTFVLSLLALSVGSAHAQSTTVVDALGQTVVEFITVDPALGLPTTQTLQTLTTTAAATTAVATTAVATTATTAADGQQGPVGVPAATSGDAGPTVYTYTTTNAGGDTVAVVDTFTPTFVTTSTWVSAPAGTVLPFSSWQGLVGTNTVAPKVSAASPRWTLQHKWFGIASGVSAAVAGGAWLVLA